MSGKPDNIGYKVGSIIINWLDDDALEAAIALEKKTNGQLPF